MSDQGVDPSESVSRFLVNGDVRISDNTVRHGAFLPPASNLKLSIFRVFSLSDYQIWALAAEKVEPSRGLVIARGDLSVAQIYDNNLKVTPDKDPTSRHADIVEWPDNRDLRATIAKVLAALASPPKKRQSFPA
jgi:hypothetical protein